jgi:hypothetical protein
MPERNRSSNAAVGVGIATALILVALWLFYDPQEPDPSQVDPEQYAQDTLGRVPKTRVPIIGTGQPPLPRHPHPERKEWREEQDLKAQWKQAQWAQYAAFFAFFSVAVTALGLWLVKQTLDANRAAVKHAALSAEATIEAARAASRQAEAAVEGNRLARIAHQNDQRPWVSFAGARLVSGATYFDGRVNFALQFRIVNSGRTPALNVRLDTKTTSLGTHMARDLNRLQPDFVAEVLTRGTRTGSLIAPGQAVVQPVQLSISREEVDAVRASATPMLAPVIIACIRYQSSFSADTLVTAEMWNILKDGNMALPVDGPDVPQEHLSLVRTPLGSGYAT